MRAGLDCIGLLVLSGQAAGKKIHDVTNYAQYPRSEELLSALRDQFDLVDPGDEQPGDVVALQIRQRVQHVGILTENGLLHTCALTLNGKKKGKVVEVALDDRWSTRIHSTWRYRTWPQ